MCIRSVIFVCLGALSFSVGLRAEWNELGWCDTPLANLDQIPSNFAMQILAQGSFYQTDAKLYLTSHALADLMPLASIVAVPRIGGNHVALREARTDGSSYGLEIGGRVDERHLVLVLHAARSGVDLAKLAQRFVDASRFMRRGPSKVRGVVLDHSDAVLSLPASLEPFSKGVYVERAQSRVQRIVRILPIYPSKPIPDQAFLQRQSEASLRDRGYEAMSAESIWLFGENVSLRHFTYKERFASAAYFKAGDWMFLLLIESRAFEGVTGILRELEEGSNKLKSGRGAFTDLKRAVRIEALSDASGAIRTVLSDAESRPVAWQGPLVPFELLDRSGSVVSSVYIRNYADLGLHGTGLGPHREAVRVRARLPAGRTLEAKILSPPSRTLQ